MIIVIKHFQSDKNGGSDEAVNKPSIDERESMKINNFFIGFLTAGNGNYPFLFSELKNGGRNYSMSRK